MTVTYPADVNVPRDIMVDLETLGTGPGCAILSIGGAAFDPATGRLGAEFHTLVSTASCRELGLREEADTLAWWRRQKPEAQAVIAEAAASDVTVRQALDRFARFLRGHGGRPRVRVWGNGADFDNAILAHLYRALGEPLPWEFWNNRCFRTLKSLNPGHEPPRAGLHHDALADARHQAAWACRIFAANAVRPAGEAAG